MKAYLTASSPWRQCEMLIWRQAVEVSASTKRRGSTQWAKPLLHEFYCEGKDSSQKKKKRVTDNVKLIHASLGGYGFRGRWTTIQQRALRSADWMVNSSSLAQI